MTTWRNVGGDAWTFMEDITYSRGNGIGKYDAAYAIQSDYGETLNGRIDAEIKLENWRSAAAGLICRATTSWTFLALFVAPETASASSTVLRIGVFKEGTLTPIVALNEGVILDDEYNHFSLEFSSGNLRGVVETRGNTYRIEYLVSNLPFPGYVGVIKLLGSTVVIRNFKFSSAIAEIASASSSPQYDVFISYCSSDREKVQEIVQALSNAGVSCWVDYEQIKVGDSIVSKIEDGLQRSRNVAVCLSTNLGRSNWCRAEYGPILSGLFNQRTGRKVLPIKLDNCSDDDVPLLLYDVRSARYSDPQEFGELIQYLTNSQ